MMNKRASFSTFINQAFILAIILLIIFFWVGGSGGFTALASFGSALAKIPGWLYVALAIIYLFSAARGK